MKEEFKTQQAFFKTHKTKSYAFRKAQLIKLKEAIEKHEEAIKEALNKDLNKHALEAYATEIGFSLYSIRHTLKNLKRWVRPKKVKSPLFSLFSKSYLYKEPKGVVLIIGPYNYPFQLIMEPLIGALAAGNTVFLKPSEFTTHTEAIIEKLITETFDPSLVKVVCGDKETTQALLELPFDHIFFTGSTQVGQIVYQAAAKHLTPVTLELGGKSPVIIDGTAKLQIAAKRIAFGKILNAGQTCVAPDYIYVERSVKDTFEEYLINAFKTMYQNDKEQLAAIVNDKHFDRIVKLIDKDKIIYGGDIDKEKRHIGPTIMSDVTWDDAVMKEEIFGPVLPILPYSNLNNVIKILQKKEKPLATYIFTENTQTKDRLLNELSFGNGAVNDTIMQVASPYLPFGGVGESGFGSYHGKSSFDTFTHIKSYQKKTTLFDFNPAYPPYKNQEKLVKKLLK